MNHNLKRFIGYLAYIAVLGCFVIMADNVERYLKSLYAQTFDLTNLWLFFFIYPILLGVLLTLPFFSEPPGKKAPGRLIGSCFYQLASLAC